MYDDGGLIPLGPSGGNYTAEMTCASTTPFKLGACMKGIRTFNVNKAFERKGLRPLSTGENEGNPPGWSCPDTRICLAGLVPNLDGQIVGENKRLRLFYGALPELEELVRPANRLDPSEKYAGKIQGAF
jgi:hypothetical protein